MIRLLWQAPDSLDDLHNMVQTAIDLEFATLPPYLYAAFSIPEGKNITAAGLVHSVYMQEMVHMCLVCNIMNALGGNVAINPPGYPGPLPGDVGEGLMIHLYPFSEAAMQQGMDIETPVDPVDPPAFELLRAAGASGPVTIGEFYALLDAELEKLPASTWNNNGNQISDAQFLQGQIFEISDYCDAHNAIDIIISEGEGSPTAGSPLDFQNELAHYYRFEEIKRNQVMTKADNPTGYVWGASLGVDWSEIYPAIIDPESHDFSSEPQDAKDAQYACNIAYTKMVDELRLAFGGDPSKLGNAVRSMFQLRMSALKALQTPLNNGQVAGPSFHYYFKENEGASS